jgi:hypothetical protein
VRFFNEATFVPPADGHLKAVTILGMSTQHLGDKAKELGRGKNIAFRGEILKALREVKYRNAHGMYGAASQAVEDLEFMVGRIPGFDLKPALKQGQPRKRNSK